MALWEGNVGEEGGGGGGGVEMLSETSGVSYSGENGDAGVFRFILYIPTVTNPIRRRSERLGDGHGGARRYPSTAIPNYRVKFLTTYTGDGEDAEFYADGEVTKSTTIDDSGVVVVGTYDILSKVLDIRINPENVPSARKTLYARGVSKFHVHVERVEASADVRVEFADGVHTVTASAHALPLPGYVRTVFI